MKSNFIVFVRQTYCSDCTHRLTLNPSLRHPSVGSRELSTAAPKPQQPHGESGRPSPATDVLFHLKLSLNFSGPSFFTLTKERWRLDGRERARKISPGVPLVHLKHTILWNNRKLNRRVVLWCFPKYRNWETVGMPKEEGPLANYWMVGWELWPLFSHKKRSFKRSSWETQALPTALSFMLWSDELSVSTCPSERVLSSARNAYTVPSLHWFMYFSHNLEMGLLFAAISLNQQLLQFNLKILENIQIVIRTHKLVYRKCVYRLCQCYKVVQDIHY